MNQIEQQIKEEREFNLIEQESLNSYYIIEANLKEGGLI